MHWLGAGQEGRKEVERIGAGDKRQVTSVLGTDMAGLVLPAQIVYQGLTERSLPPVGRGVFSSDEQRAAFKGFDFAFSDNHWSNLATMKRYITKILHPFCQRMMQDGTADPDVEQELERCLLLLDCWSVHKRSDFLDWIKVGVSRSKLPRLCV